MEETSTYPQLGETTDGFGNTLKFGDAGDFWMPPFSIGKDTDYRTHVSRVTNMKIRHDDVIIVGPLKAGMHWQHEVVQMLHSKDSNYNAEDESQHFLDVLPMSTVDKFSSPRILTTHLPFRHFPKQALENRVKVVYLQRNPKDTLASLYCMVRSSQGPMFYPGTFEHFFRLNFDIGYYYGNMFGYLMDWQEGMEAHPTVPFYISPYEDMKRDPVQGVINLNNFLGTGCSTELCEKIAEACDFDKLRSFRDSTMPTSLKAHFKEGGPTFYRKGQVGDWKNWFTVAMNEEYEEEYRKKMSGFKRQYKYTLD